MLDFISEGAGALSQGISSVGDYAKKVLTDPLEKKKKEKRDEKKGEVFGKIDEFSKPEILNEVKDTGSDFNFSGYGDTKGAMEGYFAPSDFTTKDYTNIGPEGWKEEGGGWGASTGAEKGVDWRTSDQIEEDKDKMNFVGDTYEKLKEEGVGEEPFDYDLLARTLMSIKPKNEQGPTSSGRVGGRFSFDKSLYENPLLTREYQALYQAPLYNKSW